jgi:hypothetical protein
MTCLEELRRSLEVGYPVSNFAHMDEMQLWVFWLLCVP